MPEINDPIPDATEQLKRAWESRNHMRLKAVAAGPAGYQARLIDMDSGKEIPISKITITYDRTPDGGFAVATVELFLFAMDLNLTEAIE